MLNHLSALKPCDTCPQGFLASPYNGWGSLPVVAAFQAPLDGTDDATMQQWVEMLTELTFQGCTRAQYFDLGQEIVVSAMLGGLAWHPLA